MKPQNILETCESIKFLLKADKVIGINAKSGVFWEVTIQGRRKSIWLSDYEVNTSNNIQISAKVAARITTE